MQEQKTITDATPILQSPVFPCDLVAASTFQDDKLWGVTAGPELLRNTLGASQLHCQNQ